MLEDTLRWRQEARPECVQWDDIQFMAGQPVCVNAVAAGPCAPVCFPISINGFHADHRAGQRHIRAA